MCAGMKRDEGNWGGGGGARRGGAPRPLTILLPTPPRPSSLSDAASSLQATWGPNNAAGEAAAACRALSSGTLDFRTLSAMALPLLPGNSFNRNVSRKGVRGHSSRLESGVQAG